MKSKLCRYLQLPYKFDETLLLEDLSKANHLNWKNHFNTQGYDGIWNIISLLSTTGNNDDIIAFSGSVDAPQKTELLKECSYFQSIIDTFACEKLNARLMRLEPGAHIKPHIDFELGYEDGQFRIHIPIVTSDKIEFILDGDKLIMLPGECWYTNVNFEHSVKNNSSESRVHLVIDLKRNDWSDALFFAREPKENFIKPDVIYDKDTIKAIIRNLKEMDEAGNAELIANFNAQLAKDE